MKLLERTDSEISYYGQCNNAGDVFVWICAAQAVCVGRRRSKINSRNRQSPETEARSTAQCCLMTHTNEYVICLNGIGPCVSELDRVVIDFIVYDTTMDGRYYIYIYTICIWHIIMRNMS